MLTFHVNVGQRVEKTCLALNKCETLGLFRWKAARVTPARLQQLFELSRCC